MVPQTGFPVLKAVRKNDTTYAKKVEVAKKSVPVAILVGALVLVTLFMGLVRFSTARRLRELEEYNSRPDVMQAAMEYDALVVRSERLGEQQGGADLLREYIDSYPIPDSSVNKQIQAAASKYNVKIEFNSYDAGSGVFSTTASSPVVENINKFIASLMEMDIFEEIDYTGYSWNEGDGTWSIKVICTLSGNTGKEDN